MKRLSLIVVIAALSACTSSSSIPVSSDGVVPQTFSSRSAATVVAAATSSCTSTTVQDGSLRGLAATTGCPTACATEAPNGTTANAGSLRGLAAGSQCSTICSTASTNGSTADAGSLRGLAAGGSTCSQAADSKPHAVVKPGGKHAGKHNCPASGPGEAQCDSQVSDTPSAGSTIVDPSTLPGLHPSDLRSAYKFSLTGGGNQVVGIVDAYDDPNAEADMSTYRSEFGLPPCTSVSGCFTKIGTKKNGSQLPTANTSWASEIALDLEMVSAVCPSCKILLVEAQSDQLTDLATGVDIAALGGATVLSNSYYVPESQVRASDVAKAIPHYVHPGIPITVSSGDKAYGTTFPASLPNVIAVGGTTLVPNTSARGWYETAWHGSSAGCSTYNPKPTWQTDPACAMRTIVDVAVVADPDTGVTVFDTYGGPGWYIEGGTSVGAPIIAAMTALAGNGSTLNGASALYANPSAIFPIDAGSDGSCTSYLCSALAGYDGPTGVGSPNGLGAL